MKIAVTALGDTIDSRVDRKFGRARYFVLYDTETGRWSAQSNEENSGAVMGAGISAARRLAALGAEAVLTENCGTWAFPILTSAEIDVYVGAEGHVRDALDAFERGKLTRLQGPNSVAGQTTV